MYQKLNKMLARVHRNERGITGLETAIILIAFVTVAAVLAYSVLSAGLFSAERGTETVYQGLEQAQSTMETKGSVLALSADNTTINEVVFQVSAVLAGEKIDMTSGVSATSTIRIITSDLTTNDATWVTSLLTVERGNAALLEDDEVMEITVTIPPAHGIVAYDKFTLQLIPQQGAPLTIARTAPPAIYAVNDLN
jgi:flagellin FlaB